MAQMYLNIHRLQQHGIGAFVMQIIPDNVVGALANGELLPVLFSAILFDIAAVAIDEPAKPVITFFERVADIFFKIVNKAMKVSPIGAFGAMSYTIGNSGIKSLGNLGFLMLSVYITMFIFIMFVIGAITRFYGFKTTKFIKYLKDETFIVIITSSSESALPSMMRKSENYGYSKQVVGLVVPTGYSFNLDETSIYLSLAAIFIAQAYVWT